MSDRGAAAFIALVLLCDLHVPKAKHPVPNLSRSPRISPKKTLVNRGYASKG